MGSKVSDGRESNSRVEEFVREDRDRIERGEAVDVDGSLSRKMAADRVRLAREMRADAAENGMR